MILHNAELVIEILVPLIAIWMTTILVCEVSPACMGLTYALQQEAPVVSQKNVKRIFTCT